MARYLAGVLGTAGVMLLGLSAANWALDPFGLFARSFGAITVGTDQWPLNQYARIHKPVRYGQVRPKTLILGTSRAGIGLPAEESAMGGSAYNLAVSGAGPNEVRRLLMHARAIGGYRRVIVTFDFPVSLEGATDQLSDALLYHGKSGWREILRVGVFGPLTLLLSHKTLHAACCGGAGRASNELSRTGSDGRELPLDKLARRAELGDSLAYWREQEQPYARLWQQARQRQHRDQAARRDRYREDLVGLMRALGSEAGDIRAVILPAHPWHFAVMKEGGVWGEYERWMATLVEAARVLPGPGLVDYSLSPCAWNEAVTDPDRWFIDPSHISPAFGRAILADIAGQNGTRCLDTPMHLDATSLPAFLQHLQQRLARYAAEAPTLYAAATVLARAPEEILLPEREPAAWCRLWEKL